MNERGVGFALVHASRREAIWLGRGVPDLSEALRVARRQLGWDAYDRDPLTLDLEIWGCENDTVFAKYRRVWALQVDTRSGESELRVLSDSGAVSGSEASGSDEFCGPEDHQRDEQLYHCSNAGESRAKSAQKTDWSDELPSSTDEDTEILSSLDSDTEDTD
jgi:hypothetical protein